MTIHAFVFFFFFLHRGPLERSSFHSPLQLETSGDKKLSHDSVLKGEGHWGQGIGNGLGAGFHPLVFGEDHRASGREGVRLAVVQDFVWHMWVCAGSLGPCVLILLRFSNLKQTPRQGVPHSCLGPCSLGFELAHSWHHWGTYRILKPQTTGTF